MVSVQPVFLAKYLTFRKTRVPRHLKYLFYLSWEDALWDLLAKKNVKKGSFILLPDFYCSDVEKNIKMHGYKVAHYPVKRNFLVNPKLFISKVKTTNPAVVVILHSVGITNNLLKNRDWMKVVPSKTIIIEDCAHRLVNPKDVKIWRKNYFVIDSLRKVIPIQGSRLFGKAHDIDFKAPENLRTLLYTTKVTVTWFLMQISWNLAQILRSRRFAFIAEKWMLAGYDIIGDSLSPGSGGKIFSFLVNYVDYDKVGRIKAHQVRFYDRNLSPIIRQKIPHEKKELGLLRHFPIIIPLKIADKILLELRKEGLMVRFELNDSGWSKKQKVIYLPLGLHINERKQMEICNLVINSFKN